ncbi:hypothetical protein [uncultured Gimesia sp.]|uniref:hypothetical protein n=1 Tax=uncultured Gimesia sp. TaxID=1678688 RepID=UPI0030DADDA9|tara:strand:+ start:9241 stop:9660 length:420 start_codon:yes stop_codon:yes gene_type:complete
MHHLRQNFIYLLFPILLITPGCSGVEDSRGKRVAVSGKVSYKNAPLEKGSIQFFPESGEGFQAFGKIENGAYNIDLEQGPSVGKYVVKITALKKTGKMIETEEGKEEEKKQYLPSKYNQNSELSADIKAGSNSYDFTLE